MVESRSQVLNNIRLVNALLLNKEQVNFSRLFKALNLGASSVTIDFEIAVNNALKQIASDGEISLCCFDFFQIRTATRTKPWQ